MCAAQPVDVPYTVWTCPIAPLAMISFTLRVVLAVAVLVADDRLDARAVERLLDREPFRARHRDRLLERDELRAALDPELDERQPDVGRRAEAEDVGLHLAGERRGSVLVLTVAELRGRGVEPL